MDDKDRQLLGLLHKGIPLCSRPFEEIGRRTGLDSADVLLRLTRLKEKQVTGSLTAVLESRNLGYQSLWAAMQLPEEEVDFEIGALRVNRHPGVIRSHRRLHEFNFWFTLALPASEVFEEHLKVLREVSGAKKVLAFPVLKRFRSGMEQTQEIQRPYQVFSAEEIEVLRALQDDVPLSDDPFRRLAKIAGMNEADFLEIVKRFEKQGILRRLAVLFPAEEKPLPPQDVTVWQVPQEKQDWAAARISRTPGVTQCSVRMSWPEFPYSLTAFHARGTEDLDRIAFDLEEEIGKWPWVNLPVVAEMKNTRPKYFPRELEKWSRKKQLEPAF